MILPFLSAILGILAFLPANLYFFGFAFLAPLFIFFLKEKKFWRLVLGSFIFRFIFFLGTVYFTLEPTIWLSSILIFLGLPVSVFLIKKFADYFSPKLNYPILLFSLPFLWTFFDHLEARYSLLPAYIITAGNAFGSSLFAGLAGPGGLTLLTFFSGLINVLLAAFILKIKISNPKPLASNLAGIFLLIAGAWQISNYQLQKNSAYYDHLENSLRIAVISANEKFDFSQINEIKKELAGKNFDLIIFPEDMFNEIGGTKSANFYKNLFGELKTNLLAVFDTEQGGRRYNSAVLFKEKGGISGIYNKNRLTFMGEYWPFGAWHPFFYDWLKKSDPESQNYAIFKPGNSYSRGEKKILSLNLKGGVINFAAPICLEAHYPKDLEEYRKMGTKLFINPSSNRWLTLGANHYLYLTGNLRKIETIWLKTPMIINGVKDFSGIILPDGRIIFANYENSDKNFGILLGEIRY